MFKRLWCLLFKKPVCSHDWEFTGKMIVEGATLNWSGEACRMLGWHYSCIKCDARKYKGKTVLPADVEAHHREYHPDEFDADDGWPLSKDGRRLPIVH